MRTTIALPLVTVALIGLSACSRVSPGAGESAVLTEKPMFFGHGGVDDDAITTGSAYVAWTTSATMVNIQPQQRTVEFDDLMSNDGIPLSFNATIRMKVTDPVTLIKQFGVNWYDNNISSEFATAVRQAVRKRGMNEMAIQATAVDAVDEEVTAHMQAYFKQLGIPVMLIKITVGKANPPDAIKNQRVQTAEEQQRSITEQQTQKAEVARKAAEEARADADNAYRTSMAMTPEQFIELERVKMQAKVCSPDDKDKTPNCTFIIGNATPVIGH